MTLLSAPIKGRSHCSVMSTGTHERENFATHGDRSHVVVFNIFGNLTANPYKIM